MSLPCSPFSQMGPVWERPWWSRKTMRTRLVMARQSRKERHWLVRLPLFIPDHSQSGPP